MIVLELKEKSLRVRKNQWMANVGYKDFRRINIVKFLYQKVYSHKIFY